jgi:RNA-directed DNA polymerase
LKTYRHLYPRVWDWDNLYLAYRKARKGKRGKRPAAEFEFCLEDNLVALQDELTTKTYQPGPYHSFLIYEPKRRLTLAPALARSASAGVSAAPFRDRVVHHALCNVIEPIFERRFIHDSYNLL